MTEQGDQYDNTSDMTIVPNRWYWCGTGVNCYCCYYYLPACLPTCLPPLPASLPACLLTCLLPERVPACSPTYPTYCGHLFPPAGLLRTTGSPMPMPMRCQASEAVEDRAVKDRGLTAVKDRELITVKDRGLT